MYRIERDGVVSINEDALTKDKHLQDLRGTLGVDKDDKELLTKRPMIKHLNIGSAYKSSLGKLNIEGEDDK